MDIFRLVECDSSAARVAVQGNLCDDVDIA
jgi:hypothetical protein